MSGLLPADHRPALAVLRSSTDKLLLHTSYKLDLTSLLGRGWLEAT